VIIALKETGTIALIALFISSIVWTWCELALQYTLDSNEIELLVFLSLLLAFAILVIQRKIRSALRSRHETRSSRRRRGRRTD